MGWNGSDSGGNGVSYPKLNASKRGFNKTGASWLRVFLIGILLVAVVGIAVWFFAAKPKTPQMPAKPGQPEEKPVNYPSKPVKPKTATTNDVVKAPAKKQPKTYVDKRGILRYEGGLRVVKKIVQPPADQMNSNGPHLFENQAEHEILGLMTTEPGTFMIDVKYDKRIFEKAFVESLKHNIEILPDDTPEVKEQKLAVIEAKKSLEEAYKRGEDVTEIMNESRKELVKLNRYRESLIETASEDLSKDGTTEEDLNDYVDAMNKMLKENGIREIKHKELARNVLRYQRNAAARKAAEKSDGK